MANQAIALQARAPQTDFMGRAVQQNAQMMNMMSQQRAAERQAAVAAQEMAIARAAEGRAVTAEERAARKAQQEYTVARVAYFRDQLPSVKDDVSWNNWLGRVGQEDPEYADELRRMSGGRYDPDFVNRVSMDANKYIDKTIATPTASLQVGKDLETYSATVGGTQPGVTPLMVGGTAPAQTPTAPARAPMSAPAAGGVQARPTQGAATGPQDLMQQGVNPRSIPSGNPLQPISMTTGGQMGGQPDLSAVVQDMMQTKQVSQANLQLMLDVLPPESAAQFDQILKAQNIQIVPDAEPSMRSAVFRPGEDAAPQMQLAQAVNAPGTQFRVAKDPMQSPLPGSAQVPIPRVRAEAQAARETAEEVYAKELAREKARRDAAEGRPKPLTPVQETKLRRDITKDYKSTQSTINMMLDPTSGVVAAVNSVRSLSPSQKEAITGLSGYLPSITAGSRQADTKLKNLRGKVTQMGKAAASLEGAIGQMAVQEWRIVSDMIASLDVEGMEASDLDDQLDIIEAQARRAAQITRDAYNDQYMEEFARYPNRFQLKEPAPREPKAQTNETRLPRVRTEADFRRLAPGTLFIDPNGETRRKPR